MTAEALTCAQVAAEMGYKPRVIRDLVAQGKFPQPIDPTLSKKSHRWSSLDVAAYKNRTWKADAA